MATAVDGQVGPGQPVPPEEGASPPPASFPTAGARIGWRAWATSPLALLPLALVLVVGGVLLVESGGTWFGWSFFGFSYFFDPTGGPSTFGVSLFLVDSAIVALPALAIASGLSLAMAAAIVVYLPAGIGRALTVLTNLLAGIPSVVYGIWGYVVLAPYFGSTVQPTLKGFLGWIPFLGGPLSPGGVGSLLAIAILTLMIVPIATAVMRESLRAVPHEMIEAGLALGATPWEVLSRVRIPAARRGLWGATFLGLGRALGESVAVAMVIGASVWIPPNLYQPSTTLASFVFFQLDSAFYYPTLLRALIEFSLVLLALATAVNLLGHRASGSDPTVLVSRGGG
ncbi:MAG: phosphate ABC transporter permease subunit PstC [Thermoplasmata archaeon]